jgi:protein ImuA
MPPDDRHHVLAALRETIQRLERRPARRGGVVPSGLPQLDAALPGGGFPRGALSELSGGLASGKTVAALAVLAALPPDDLFAWVDARGELYPPGAAARGVDLSRLLIVRPAPHARASAPDACAGPSAQAPRLAPSASGGSCAEARTLVSDMLWAAEALLGSGAFAAVVVDLPLRTALRGWDGAARRLQAAVEKGGAVGLWLGEPGAAVRVPATVRVAVAMEHGLLTARSTSASARASTPALATVRQVRAGHAA